MAIIYSYPLNDDIKPLDELVGTTEQSINGQLKTVTRNFLLQDLAEFFIVDGGLQKTITLTTTGASGEATLNQLTGVLNIPQYQGALLGTGFVKSAAGVITYDTNSYYLASNPNGFIPLTALSSSATGLTYNNTTGVFSLTVGYSIPTTASQTNWDNAYTYRLAGITTNGTSGAATLINNILNIPQYSGGGGSQNLQQVTDIGASTTNAIYIGGITNDYGLVVETSSNNYPSIYVDNVASGINANGIEINSFGGTGAKIYNQNGVGIRAESISGIPIVVFGNGNNTASIDVNLGNTNKGLVIDSGTSSTGNFIDLNKNGVNKFTINQQGEQSIVKIPGGTSSQILAADGSVITAGNNITISGGQISSVGGSGGGGSTVNYYLNGGTSQGTFSGTTYYEFSRTAILGTGVDFTRNTDGYIASFITDVADPSLLLIPAGNWNLEFYFSSSSAGGSPSFYTELYKYNGTTFTLIASDSATPEGITNGTTIDAYFTALAVPETTLTVNDRLAIRVYVNTSGRTITLHTQNGHLCEVITTFTNGLTALNGLQAQVQNFQVGTSGTDFAIDSSGSTHTFNLPNASATARGVVSTGTQTFAGQKTFSSISFGATGLPTFFEYVGIPFLTVGTGLTFSIGGGPGNAQNNLAVPNGTFNIGLQTASTIASFDANRNVVALTAANGYPTLAELKWLSGATSSIQTQLNNKQPINANLTSISTLSTAGGPYFVKVFGGNYFLDNAVGTQGAHTILANNTSASAPPTEQPFENLTNQTYSGTIVWTGTTAPSSTTQHTYSLSQIGNLVTLTINLSYLAAGNAITAVAVELPSTAPTPALPASVLTVGDVLNYGNGMLAVAKTIPTTNAAFCALRIKSTSPNVYEIVINRTSAAYRYAYITIQYFV